MKNIGLGIIIAILIFFTYKYFSENLSNGITIQEHSALIQKQINQVGKLIVTEGHFSEVFDYKKSKALFTNYISVEKKALVVVNAEVTVAYDLSKIEYRVDKKSRTLKIISIPEEEIKINPDFEYYDIQQGFLNPFEANDYNAIKEAVNKSLAKKIEASSLKLNAKNRLISELSKFYILTHSLGWTLEYRETPVNDLEQLSRLKL